MLWRKYTVLTICWWFFQYADRFCYNCDSNEWVQFQNYVNPLPMLCSTDCVISYEHCGVSNNWNLNCLFSSRHQREYQNLKLQPLWDRYPLLPVDSTHNEPVMWKGFPCHDVVIDFHFKPNRMFFLNVTQIAKFLGPTWSPPGSCRPQTGPMLAP